ncbi:hypothetical protein LTR50_001895 [Elasticomyces elasticus]|nr:hypothetical protein LTR50_001895 [Elasticomyces elasticus]
MALAFERGAVQQKRERDPFRNPSAISAVTCIDKTSPRAPPPARLSQRNSAQEEAADDVAVLLHQYRRESAAYHAHTAASLSSMGTSLGTGIRQVERFASTDPEKGGLSLEYTPKLSQAVSDPEKLAPDRPYHPYRPSGMRRHSCGSSVAYGIHESWARTQEENAVKILFFLSGPCAILSLLAALWTILALTLTTLTQPLNLCTTRPSFGTRLKTLLAPMLNLQLRAIYSPPPLPPDVPPPTYHLPTLLLVHLASPLLGLGLALAGWTLAVYWLFAAMVGNPDGLDGRDDGREAVLGVRRWWEGWLGRAVR